MAALQHDLAKEHELIETHISWVFLSEHDVYKVKKPVDLGFLDFSTLEKRHAACIAEVALNRRLARGVYFGLASITKDESGEHRIGGQGVPVDWAVHMRRLPDSNRADTRLEEGRLSMQGLDAIVVRLAEFHENVGPAVLSNGFGGFQSVLENIEENFAQTRELLPRYLEINEIEELISWQRDFLRQHEQMFGERVRSGRVREGHGDLRLEHVYLQDSGEIDVLDCIEFNERFRIADVCADIVFLAMDLARSGRADLAERVLAVYARESNDFDMFALVDFYESYRAFVRGKISAFQASSGTLDTQGRARADAEARRHFLLALASERRSVLPPIVVACGGIIASGKSTVANRIASELSAPVVNADRTRKYLAGIAPRRAVDAAAFGGMYSLEFTQKTYREVVRRGRLVIGSGRAVVLDASFRPRWTRDLARQLSEECGVPFCFVECRVDEDICLERLKAREKRRGVSDGRIEIFDDFVKRWEPVTEFDADQHVVIDTALPLEDNIKRLRARIPTWPAQLKG